MPRPTWTPATATPEQAQLHGELVAAVRAAEEAQARVYSKIAEGQRLGIPTVQLLRSAGISIATYYRHRQRGDERKVSNTIRAVIVNPDAAAPGPRERHALAAIERHADGRTVQPHTLRLVERTTAADEAGLEALPPDTPVEVWEADCLPDRPSPTVTKGGG